MDRSFRGKILVNVNSHVNDIINQYKESISFTKYVRMTNIVLKDGNNNKFCGVENDVKEVSEFLIVILAWFFIKNALFQK